MEKLKIEYVDIDKLTPYSKNAKIHTDEQIEHICNSINEFGFADPIGITGKDNLIVEGHGRLLSAKKLGMKTVPVIRLDHLTEEQRKMYTLTHNQTTMTTGWDDELLDLELTELTMDFDVNDFGFDFELPNDLNEDEADTVPELEENPCIKLGDLIELGEHRVLCGDSMKEEDVSKLMDDKKSDITFTSPPYNAGKTPKENGKYHKDKDNKSTKEYTDFLNSFTKICLMHSDYVFSNIQSISGNKISLIEHLYEMRKNFADVMIWNKGKGQPAMARRVMNSAFEYVYIFSNEATRAIGKRDFRGNVSNIFELNPLSGKEFSSIHRATFRVELPEMFIDWFVESSVYDPFCGTGTTLIACENKSKICYGMELDEKYAQVIIQRWVDYTSIDTIKINGVEVSWSEYKALAEMPSN